MNRGGDAARCAVLAAGPRALVKGPRHEEITAELARAQRALATHRDREAEARVIVATGATAGERNRAETDLYFATVNAELFECKVARFAAACGPAASPSLPQAPADRVAAQVATTAPAAPAIAWGSSAAPAITMTQKAPTLVKNMRTLLQREGHLPRGAVEPAEPENFMIAIMRKLIASLAPATKATSAPAGDAPAPRPSGLVENMERMLAAEYGGSQ